MLDIPGITSSDTIRLIIHVPHREKRNYRLTLVGLKDALCVTFDGIIWTYDLLPPLKPRKGQEHRVVQQLADQLKQGWTLMVWDSDCFLHDLRTLVEEKQAVGSKAATNYDRAWATIALASDQDIVDLKSFRKFPHGHYLELLAFTDKLQPEDFQPRFRKYLKEAPKRPLSEDLWLALQQDILPPRDSLRAVQSYQRWLKNNRPSPPKHDSLGVSHRL